MRARSWIPLLMLLAALLSSNAVCQQFSTPRKVSPDGALNASGARVALADNGAAYLTWTDGDILFRRSDKKLGRLAPVRRLTPLPGNAYGTSAAVSGRNVYIAWEEFTPDGEGTNYTGDRYDVMFAASHNNGANFRRAITVNPDMPSSVSPQVATAPDGTVYVAWADFRTGEVYLRSSRNHGRTLTPPINVSNDAGFSMAPQITVDASGAVHLVWSSEVGSGWNIFYARSDDGATFSAPQDLTAVLGGHSYSPALAVANGYVYVAWNHESGVRLCRSSNGGMSFELPVEVSSPTQWPGLAQLAAAGDNVYVLFTAYEPFFTKVFLARSNDDGSSFAAPMKVSDAWSESPRVKAQGDRADLVWQNRSSGAFEVLYSRTLDGGNTWTSARNVSNSAPESVEPWIDTSADGTVAVTWSENGAEIWWATGR